MAVLIRNMLILTEQTTLLTFSLRTKTRKSPSDLKSSATGTVNIQHRLVSWLPAPQSPDGLRPVCIQSLFILCTSLIAVIETSWFFSPNSSRWAKRGMYRHGSEGDSKDEEDISRLCCTLHGFNIHVRIQSLKYKVQICIQMQVKVQTFSPFSHQLKL